MIYNNWSDLLFYANMLFLSDQKKKSWYEYADFIIRDRVTPDKFKGVIRSNLTPVFSFYAGVRLAIDNQDLLSEKWFLESSRQESADPFLASFV
jgi:hypothetical protein